MYQHRGQWKASNDPHLAKDKGRKYSIGAPMASNKKSYNSRCRNRNGNNNWISRKTDDWLFYPKANWAQRGSKCSSLELLRALGVGFGSSSSLRVLDFQATDSEILIFAKTVNAPIKFFFFRNRTWAFSGFGPLYHEPEVGPGPVGSAWARSSSIR